MKLNLAVAACAALTLAYAAFADTAVEKVNGYEWTYEIVDGKAVIGNGSDTAVLPSPSGALTIPAKLGGKSVVRIASSALSGCSDITAVTIPASVTSLGYMSFAYCYKLTSIAIPDTVTEIDDSAFLDSGLQCVQIGKKVNTLGEGVFNQCSDLRAIIFKTDALPATVAATFLNGIPADAEIYVPKTAKKWPKGENGMPATWMGHRLNYGDYVVDVVAKVFSTAMEKYGKVTGGGEYAVGKKVSLKATVEKDCVFAGWGDNVTGEFLTYSTTYSYTVTGADTEFLAMFATKAQDEASLRLDFPKAFYAEEDGWLEVYTHGEYVVSASEPKLTFKGLPSGVKYDAKTFKISGKATKPGIYTVTVSAKNTSVKTAITQDFTIIVSNFTDTEIPVDDSYGPFIPGDYIYEDFSGKAEGCAVTGLPAGMKWTTKEVVDKTLGVIPAYSVYGAASKPGTYTVYFTKTVDKVKHTATATFIVGDFPKLEIVKEGNGDGTVTGEGGYPANKKVALKATPDKESVFEGWFDEFDSCLSQSASYSYIMGLYNETLKAKFMTKKEDYDAISVDVDASGVPAFDDKLVTEVTLPCGVRVYWPLLVDARSEATVKVSGLPTGLKFTAKDVVDPKTKEVIAYANTIYGAPTAASKTESSGGFTPRMIPSEVKIEVTTSGKTKKTYLVKVSVKAMPYWAATTFVGGDAYGGLASITVAGTGKISGKIIGEAGATETISATEFNYYTPDKKEYETVVTMKQGQFVGDSVMTLTALEWGLSKIQLHAYKDCYLYSVPWKSCDPWITLAKKFTTAAAKTLEVKDVKDNDSNSGILTLQFDASGSVKAKGEFMVPDKNGKLAKYTASCSTFVAPITKIQFSDDEFDAYVYVSFPLKKDKFAGYSAKLELHWNGTAFSVK